MDEYFGKPDDFETLFSLLYTLYAVPNIVLPFFGGYFTDKWGARFCLLMFSSLLTIGQVVFALGLSIKSWPLMYLGRIIFGCGGENMNVANSAILSVWFKDKELAFAFGLNLSISRLGSVANNLVSPVITDSVDIVFALWFGVLLCGCSVACAVLISHLDHGVEVQILQNKGLCRLLIPRETDKIDDGSTVKDKLVATSVDRLSDAETVVIVSPITVADDNHLDGDNHDYLRSSKERSSSLTSRVIIKSPLTSIAIPPHKVDDNDDNDADEADVHTPEQVEPSLRDIFSFKLVFWIICCSCVVVYGMVLDTIALRYITYTLYSVVYIRITSSLQ